MCLICGIYLLHPYSANGALLACLELLYGCQAVIHGCQAVIHGCLTNSAGYAQRYGITPGVLITKIESHGIGARDYGYTVVKVKLKLVIFPRTYRLSLHCAVSRGLSNQDFYFDDSCYLISKSSLRAWIG